MRRCQPEMLAFIEVEMPNPTVISKIRNYLQKWRPLRMALPVGELDALGVPRGPKFDKILEQLFELQLRGQGRDSRKTARRFCGILRESRKSRRKSRKKKRSGKAKTRRRPKRSKKRASQRQRQCRCGACRCESGARKDVRFCGGCDRREGKGETR